MNTKRQLFFAVVVFSLLCIQGRESDQVHAYGNSLSSTNSARELTCFYFSDDRFLSELIDEALEANPAISESEHRWRAALERIPQLTALPDPVVTITHFIRETETRVGPQKDMISVSQKFPWFGKLDARGEMALRDGLAAAEQYQARAREVVAAVKRAYYNLAYLDEAIRITEEDKDLLDHFEEIAETRYSTGKGIQQAVIRIQAEITRDDDRLYLLKRQRESAAAALNTLVNRSPHEPIPTLTGAPVPETDFNVEELYAMGRNNRHELKAARYMVEKGEQAVRLAKKEYFPDFTLGFNYILVDDREDSMGKLNPPSDNGRDAYSLMLGFNIPLWEGKNMSAVKEAEELRRASENGYDRIENEMELFVRDAVLRAETAHSQLDLYGKVLIPQAERALDSTQAAYATGTLNALDLIDSERFLLNVRLAHAKLESDYMSALADIEWAIGTAFPVHGITGRGNQDGEENEGGHNE
jgi:outer membrane protein TolC